MRHAATSTVLGYLHRTARPEGATDRELLRRFAGERDEAAFAALVERHGPMVLRVCRRTLGDAHEAEDACQKVFLALASKANSPGWHDSIASWLHQAAFHHARRARGADARRRAREGRAPAPAPATRGPDDELTARELLAALDEELSQLPETYHAPLVLCYLEGLTRDEAARRLGLPLGTLKSRVERGRELLRERLEGRGLGLSALLIAESLPPALPPGLASAVVTAALSAGGSAGPAMVTLALLLFGGVVTALLMSQPAAVTTPLAAPPAEPGRLDRHGDALPPGAVARLGTSRLRAGMGPCLVAPLPGGKAALSVSRELTGNALVMVWDLATGRELRRFDGPPLDPDAYSVDLSADGKTLLCVSEGRRGGGRVSLHDVTTGKPLPSPVDVDVSAAALSRDGKTLAAIGTDGALRLYGLPVGKPIRRWNVGAADWVRLAFSPDGGTLVGGPARGAARLWSVATGRELDRLSDTDGWLFALCFSPDGKTVAAAYGLTTIRLYDTASQKERRLETEVPVRSLAFSPDGATLASGDGRSPNWPRDRQRHLVRLWDVKTGRELRQLPGHPAQVRALAFLADDRLLSGGGASALRLHDTATGKQPLTTPDAHRAGVNAVAVSPDGKAVATAGYDGSVRLWDTRTGRHLLTFEDTHADHPSRVVFSPDGRRLASSGYDGGVSLWDIALAKRLGRLPLDSRHNQTVAYSPDGRALVTSGTEFTNNLEPHPRPVRFWDAGTRKELPGPAVITSNTWLPNWPFSPDGKRLVTLNVDIAAKQTTAHVWDVDRHAEARRCTLPLVFKVACSPDTRTAAGIRYDEQSRHATLFFLDLTDGKTRSFPLPEGVHPHYGDDPITFSPDGRLVAFGTLDGTVILWDVAAGKIRRRLSGHVSLVEAFAFSPDGTRLVSGGYDGTALVWDVTGLTGAKWQAGTPSPAGREEIWAALAADATRADQAMIALMASPTWAKPFLKERLRPAAAIDERQVARLIEQLGSDRFQERQEATRELERMGESVRPALVRALEGKPSLEARRRVERLVRLTDGPALPAEQLRELRAVEVLEHLGATELLQVLANGEADARLTCEAVAALKRLSKR